MHKRYISAYYAQHCTVVYEQRANLCYTRFNYLCTTELLASRKLN
jgi:hypothetical protein